MRRNKIILALFILTIVGKVTSDSMHPDFQTYRLNDVSDDDTNPAKWNKMASDTIKKLLKRKQINRVAKNT